MKILTVTIPCYNSAAYMRRAIECALKGGDRVEVIVVDDGSSDNTLEIAKEYEANYPNIVRAIHKENGGHGSAVNTGIANAEGFFFKVLDSDDWFNEKSYKRILDTLSEIVEKREKLDLLISNYVYEKEGRKLKKAVRYNKVFPKDKIFEWDEVKHFKLGQYIIMHTAIFSTRLLKEIGLTLPEHTFYVDSIFVFKPMPYVKKMMYLDENFYRYYIGRVDQSVQEDIMIKRIDQQLRVNYIMIDYMAGVKNTNKKMYNYMVSYLLIITTISSILFIRMNTKEALERKKTLWHYIKTEDSKDYKKLIISFLGIGVNLPFKFGRKLSVLGYKIGQKIFGFN